MHVHCQCVWCLLCSLLINPHIIEWHDLLLLLFSVSSFNIRWVCHTVFLIVDIYIIGSEKRTLHHSCFSLTEVTSFIISRTISFDLFIIQYDTWNRNIFSTSRKTSKHSKVNDVLRICLLLTFRNSFNWCQ